jgi:hypothetical protein
MMVAIAPALAWVLFIPYIATFYFYQEQDVDFNKQQGIRLLFLQTLTASLVDPIAEASRRKVNARLFVAIAYVLLILSTLTIVFIKDCDMFILV